MHPTLPQREGEDLKDTADANGVHYVQDLYDNAKKGGGFVTLAFPKPPSMENAPKLAYVEFIPGTDIWLSTGIYIDNIDIQKAAIATKHDEDIKRRMTIIIGTIAAVLLFILGPFCFFILRSISKPLNATVKAAEELAKGNMDIAITVNGKDEITTLERSFIKMSGNLREMFSNLQIKETEANTKAEEAKKANAKILNIAGRVEQAAHDMERAVSAVAQNASGVKSGSSNQTSRISEILADMEQLNSGVLKITDSSDRAAKKSSESNQMVEAGTNMAEESGEAMDHLHTITGTMTENIHNLGKQSENIGNIMKLITDIAAQINLLAMNASIEAAHAGDSGKGFAVVAGEVRKLAEKTRSAINEVETSIKSMQELTQVNIKSMDNVVTSINRVTELSKKTASSLSEAQLIVKDVMMQVQSIASSEEEQSESSKVITSLVNEVSGLARNNSGMISEIDDEISGLHKKAEELLALVSELKS
jgi:methyl-accepting chemotaxis protein